MPAAKHDGQFRAMLSDRTSYADGSAYMGTGEDGYAETESVLGFAKDQFLVIRGKNIVRKLNLEASL